MLFLSKITILHIFYRFGDHMTKKKIVTRDVTNFSLIKDSGTLSNHNLMLPGRLISFLSFLYIMCERNKFIVGKICFFLNISF